MAEREGFEPPEPFGSPHFECGALDHSATSPAHEGENVELPPQNGSRKFTVSRPAALSSTPKPAYPQITQVGRRFFRNRERRRRSFGQDGRDERRDGRSKLSTNSSKFPDEREAFRNKSVYPFPILSILSKNSVPAFGQNWRQSAKFTVRYPNPLSEKTTKPHSLLANAALNLTLGDTDQPTPWRSTNWFGLFLRLLTSDGGGDRQSHQPRPAHPPRQRRSRAQEWRR